MLNTHQIQRRLAPAFTDEQAEVLAEVVTDAYNALVKTSDFNELKDIVRELAQAQRELTVAQQRTEGRLEELAVAQQRTEGRLEELAAAQQRTEEAVRQLAFEHGRTRQQVGGLSTTIGYTLENEAYKVLPELLARDYGLAVQEKLKRGYLTDNKGQTVEVNIIGRATKDDQEVMIIGESKSQLSKNEVDRFIRRRLERFSGVFRHIFPLLITHMTTEPDVEAYVQNKGIALYYSYDF
jgi:hypothetical protein